MTEQPGRSAEIRYLVPGRTFSERRQAIQGSTRMALLEQDQPSCSPRPLRVPQCRRGRGHPGLGRTGCTNRGVRSCLGNGRHAHARNRRGGRGTFRRHSIGSPMSAPDLDGRIALITGAAGGIGQPLARAFVGAGMRVALCDTSEDGVLRLHGELGADRTLALPTGRVGPRCLPRQRRPHDCPFRPPRCAGQQCRGGDVHGARRPHAPRRADRGYCAGALGPLHGGQPVRPVLHGPRRRAGHARPKIRADHQRHHQLFHDAQSRLLALRPGQVRPGSLEHQPGRRTEGHRHNRQCRGARRAHRHADGAGRRVHGTQPVDPPGKDGAPHAASRVRCRRCRHRHALRRREVGFLSLPSPMPSPLRVRRPAGPTLPEARSGRAAAPSVDQGAGNGISATRKNRPHGKRRRAWLRRQQPPGPRPRRELRRLRGGRADGRRSRRQFPRHRRGLWHRGDRRRRRPVL